jgi:Phosphoesterase family
MKLSRARNTEKRKRRRVRVATGAAAAGVIALCIAAVTGLASTKSASSDPVSCPQGSTLQVPTGGGGAQCVITATGTPVGAVKHVWLIILENKSYDENFSGLNQNSYLWQTLPQQGALLTKYYGTGHFSMDNYISLVSGQSPSYDVQNDCATTAGMTNTNDGVIKTGTVGTGTDTDLTSSGSGRFTTAPTTSGTGNGNFGQLLVHGGIDAANGANGCVYPTGVPTLFNQLNAAGVSWKGYAQDLGGAQPVGSATYVTSPASPGVTDTVPGRDDGLCGYPGTITNNPVTSPTVLTSPTGIISSFTGAQPANANSNGDPADQYVAKHFPFGWFTALTGEQGGTQNGLTYNPSAPLNTPSTPEYDGPSAPTDGSSDGNCDANHISNLDDPTYGLAHDLTLPANEVPAFSWITPNNCSDAHDASCQGNNLSGAFNADGTPNYTPQGLPADDPEATTPTNYTGGLYASDLFLRYYIPLIEQSAAFKDGGLIDITFDEANPPFTIGNSFNNVPAPGDISLYSDPADKPTFGSPGTQYPGAGTLYGAYGDLTDAAGENINGQNVPTEPTGPNDPEVTDSSGNQLQPGPGEAGFIDRPSTTVVPNQSANVSHSPGATVEVGQVAPGSSLVTDSKINADDTGRLVSGAGIPADTFVGAVSDTGPYTLTQNASVNGASNNFAKPWIGTFQLVDDSGQPVTLANGFSGNMTLSAEGVSTIGSANCPASSEQATTPGCVTQDPLLDATDFTPGGGDTGTVLISPLIQPGTVTDTYYNHYSTIRTLEDLLLTGTSCTDPATALPAGTVCGGLDGQGHIGYAAQAGLGDFGPDVFDAQTFTQAPVPDGYHPVSASGAATLYCPNGANLGGSRLGFRGDQGNGQGKGNDGTAGTAGAAGCGSTGGAGGQGGRGGQSGHGRHETAGGVGGNGGNGGNGACAPEEWQGVWLTADGSSTTPADTPPCDGHGGNGGNGGDGGNGNATFAGGNGGNGGDGAPGHHGGNGGNGGNAGPHGAGQPGDDGTAATSTQNGQNGQNG